MISTEIEEFSEEGISKLDCVPGKVLDGSQPVCDHDGPNGYV